MIRTARRLALLAALLVGAAGAQAALDADERAFIDEMVRYAEANTPVPEALDAKEVGNAAAFLASPLASGITGVTLYVDKGFHAMGKAVAWPEASSG